MELFCAFAAFVVIIIAVYLFDDSSSSPTPYRRVGDSTASTVLGSKNWKVKITGRDDLTSWALHKPPEDIEAHDYTNLSALDADIVIHRDGGINKVIKGPGEGSILSDSEVDKYKDYGSFF